MTAHVITTQWADAIAFNRLHALVKRGYKLRFDTIDNDDFSCIDLVHPKRRGAAPPPRLTLWSNGIVSTPKVLWPQRYVEQEDGPPDWQRYIDVSDGDRFDELVNGIPVPNAFDTFFLPALRHLKTFSARFLFGSSLCAVIAVGVIVVRPVVALL